MLDRGGQFIGKRFGIHGDRPFLVYLADTAHH
jgi:hypothetical protein